jgi:PAS domain-containing protein/DNA-binding CsgD family transcriptional regulator
VWARNEDQLQPGRAVTSSMLYPDDQLMRTEYGNDWLRPQDLFYAVGGILDRAGTVAMKFSFVRPQRYGPFDNQALALWQTLVPHVQRAADLHRRLMMAERRAGDAESTLDLLSEGVLLLRADGTVLHANPSAAALLGAHKGLGLDKDGKLLAAEPAARKALAAELHAALNPGALPPAAAFQPRLLSLRGLKGRLELSFNALPLRSERTPVRAAAAVFIVDPDAAPPDLAAGLGVLWHLTAAETALTCDLVGGLTVQQHADARGIALTTARSHLRTASAKLGIKRQADLVRVVLAHLQILRRR